MFDAFSGARTPGATPGAQAAGGQPALVAAPGGVSKGESYELFLRPTSAAPSSPTLEGQRYELRAFDARPQGGGAR